MKEYLKCLITVALVVGLTILVTPTTPTVAQKKTTPPLVTIEEPVTAVAVPVAPVAPAPILTGCEAVRGLASKYGDWDINIITAISQAESSCRADATGDGHITYEQNGRTYGYSLSAMQVRILPGREHCDTHDLTVNIDCAHAIWLNQSYRAWSVYLSGKYLNYL